VLSSFAVFVIVETGVFLAGNSGPFAHLRWLAGVLAGFTVAAALVFEGSRRGHRVRSVVSEGWRRLSDRLVLARSAGDLIRKASDNLGLVRPGIRGWAEAFGLALGNWLYDAATLVACIEALHVRVPWHAILVIYGFTQISASLPITPGGLGIVEASMAALLVAYGTPSTTALAVVLLYRIVSFWGLVPIGWAVWFGLEIANRGGIRRRAHPWASHQHGDEPATDAPPVGPERILRPKPCVGCPDSDGDFGYRSDLQKTPFAV
jgi:putative heme transporter